MNQPTCLSGMHMDYHNNLAFIRPTLEWLQRVGSLKSLDFWCCQNVLGEFRGVGEVPHPLNFLASWPLWRRPAICLQLLWCRPPKGAWIWCNLRIIVRMVAVTRRRTDRPRHSLALPRTSNVGGEFSETAALAWHSAELNSWRQSLHIRDYSLTLPSVQTRMDPARLPCMSRGADHWSRTSYTVYSSIIGHMQWGHIHAHAWRGLDRTTHARGRPARGVSTPWLTATSDAAMWSKPDWW